MSGIQLPGRVHVGVVEHENGQAFPSSTGIGQQFHIFGGLTKLEYVSALVAARVSTHDPSAPSLMPRHLGLDDWAAKVADRAEAILAECAARQAKDSPPTA